MRINEYERMYTRENTHWWFQGRETMVFRLLLRHTPLENGGLDVLDVGCGTGLILEALRRYTKPIGIDVAPEAVAFCRERNLDRLVSGRGETMPFCDRSFDLVLALDIFEHVDRDDVLLDELWRICRPGGHLLITVPAYPRLWSEHDEALNHKRRYTRRSFRGLIEPSGFEIVKFTNAMTLLMPFVVCYRKALNTWRHAWKAIGREREPRTHLEQPLSPLNWLYLHALRLESRLLRHVDFPLGVSILTLLRKPDEQRRP